MSDASASATKPRRGIALPLFIAAIGSTVLFLVGLFPAYDFAKDGGVVPDAAEPCPEATPTEQGYDVACVRRLVARGPLYLGKEALAGSFALGFGAIGGLWAGADRRWTRRAATVAGIVFLALTSLFLMTGAAATWQLVVLAALELAGCGAAFVAARRSARLAATLLLVTYTTTWLALLVWNAAEAARHTGVSG